MNRIAITLLALGSALVLAACGGDDEGDAGGGTEGGAAASAGAGTVAVRDTELGRILVDGRGMALYLFEKDRGGESTCYGACASDWPPLIESGQPEAGEGAQAGELGTVQRRDGSEQVTYAGHPLCYFAGDQAPGDTSGQDLDQYGAEWYALTPAGGEAEDEDGEAEHEAEPEEDGSGPEEDEPGDDQGSGAYDY